MAGIEVVFVVREVWGVVDFSFEVHPTQRNEKMRMSMRNGKNFIERKIHETYLFCRLSCIYVVSILLISLFSFKFATD